MLRHYHIYECTGCIVTFAVEVAFENQSDISCPACGFEMHVEDIGHGQMVETHNPIEDGESVEG